MGFYVTYPQIRQTLSAKSSPGLLADPIWKSLSAESGGKESAATIECVLGNWSVRELRRQIGSLYYERSGLSKNKEKLAALVKSGAEAAEPRLAIRDPYVFEFLAALRFWEKESRILSPKQYM